MRLVTRVKSKEGNFKVAYFKDNEQKQKARDYLSKCGKSKNLMRF
ncbi:hypothetical protein CFF8240_1709 [Campylobacter fetus subsp. fetus 82-40]|nr:hypothetical protein CFF8240_1709 [Campylobacter fetus subsp. fetus 82-40]